MDLEELAKQIAKDAHQGQYRADGITPYITHPAAVVQILEEHGFGDEKTKIVGWLHDTIEDTYVTKEDIVFFFGNDVANNVADLTRNCSREDYKARIVNSSTRVQVVKLADTLHNVRTLDGVVKEKIIRNKVKDCREVYISLAEKICPKIAEELEARISKYEVEK